MEFVPTKESEERAEKAHQEFLALLNGRTIQEYEDDLEHERLARAKIRNADPDYQKLWEPKK